MKHITLNIEGMHCGSCSTSIELMLGNTDGVHTIKVDFNAKKAEVDFDENKITEQGIIASIEEVGFKASI